MQQGQKYITVTTQKLWQKGDEIDWIGLCKIKITVIFRPYLISEDVTFKTIKLQDFKE